ncbi:putative quinol monooxygenase [Mumia sp. Pv 4-285]|uniref:putative quinol monooxygenase n=1 Tax=Mumia qirimensis TaxID=3234852 RepID=UPI00351D144F
MAINVVALFTVKAGEGPAFESAIAAARPAMLDQEGCERYDLQRRVDDENAYVLLEEYASGEALREHGSSPEFTALVTAVTDLLAEPMEVLLLRPVGDQQG